MRCLLTEECDDIWKALGAKRPFGDDTRIFKKLISTQSFKRTPKFFDQKALTDDDRVNVIHRIRFLAKERESFKAFSSSETEFQSQCVLAAKRKLETFDAFLGDEEWPSELENLQRNMLQTTLLDSVVREHTSGNEELLPTILSAYLKATGAHGSQKLGQYRRMREIEEGQSDEVVGTSACRLSRADPDCEEENRPGISERNSDSLEDAPGHETADGNGQNETTQPLVERDNPDAVLKAVKMELRIETLLEYERGSLGIDSSFDFIIADP